jgi:hypothetical protein
VFLLPVLLEKVELELPQIYLLVFSHRSQLFWQRAYVVL